MYDSKNNTCMGITTLMVVLDECLLMFFREVVSQYILDVA